MFVGPLYIHKWEFSGYVIQAVIIETQQQGMLTEK